MVFELYFSLHSPWAVVSSTNLGEPNGSLYLVQAGVQTEPPQVQMLLREGRDPPHSLAFLSLACVNSRFWCRRWPALKPKLLLLGAKCREISMLLPPALRPGSNRDHHPEINLFLPSDRREKQSAGFSSRFIIMGKHMQINGSPRYKSVVPERSQAAIQTPDVSDLQARSEFTRAFAVAGRGSH